MTGSETRLGPDDLVSRDFAIGLRGYDRDEVDTFLARAADAWRTSLTLTPPINGSAAPTPAARSAATEPEPEPESSAEASGAPVARGPFAPGGSPEATQLSDTSEEDPAAATPGTRAAAQRDRASAYAARQTAELDRAQARTELAQAQEEALLVVDQAQRRAEAVLTGAHHRARAEAETVLEDARTRLTPLLEQERTVWARLTRLRRELEALADEGATDPTLSLPDAGGLVSAVEDDPETPDTTFPVGYGSVNVPR